MGGLGDTGDMVKMGDDSHMGHMCGIVFWQDWSQVI